jgi:hypothetical protein
VKKNISITAYSTDMTDGDFCQQGRDTEIAKTNLRLSKHTDMTIHWKGLSDGTISFFIQPFSGKERNFLNFSPKNSLKAQIQVFPGKQNYGIERHG